MLAFAVYQSTHIRPWGELLWFIRSDALIYGSLIAFAWHNYGAQLTRAFAAGKKIYWQLAFALVIPLPVLLSKISATPYYMGLVAVSAGLVILLCSANKDLTGNQNPVKTALVYIGSRSYSIYLIHFPVFAVLRELVLTSGTSDLTAELDKIVATVVAMFATVLLAEFSFRKVETPLRDYGRKLSENWAKSPARETLASSAA
jgi:peptidoglycan/LPS O-acetylase OafA/YrhL